MNLKESILTTIIKTPIGEMVACATEKGLCLLEFKERKDLNKQLKSLTSHFNSEIISGHNSLLLKLQEQFDQYFNRNLKSFNIPIHLVGTDFQKSVWNLLRDIPFGMTISYMDLTKKLGNPDAIRAVANANAANKIAIVIPCHRVIGSDGKLTGYAGSLWRKNYLLKLEDETMNKQLTIEGIL